jgi:hypothetical protein
MPVAETVIEAVPAASHRIPSLPEEDKGNGEAHERQMQSEEEVRRTL